jgi:carboxyl-terminal processing protease
MTLIMPLNIRLLSINLICSLLLGTFCMPAFATDKAITPVVTKKPASIALKATAEVKPSVSPQALYDEVWTIIAAKFVDESKNGQDWRIWRHRYDATMKTPDDAYVCIETMLASLDDRYTRFLTPTEFKDERDSIKAVLFGIGIQIGVKENKLLVIAPLEDTPAARAGLKSNDEILSIDSHSALGMSVKDGASFIKGEKGTSVKLLIKRDGKEIPFVVVRDEIKLKSVSTKPPFEKTVIPNTVGYIKLSSFISNSAGKEFVDALNKMPDKAGYIIDLRSNPGGLLENATSIADLFLKEGGIVSTVDRDGYKIVTEASSPVITDKPLVVLIDDGSASASEILSGALKDHARATLVGRKSFGKGLVQEINGTAGGTGLHVTTQKYLTPNDIDINKKGIDPDVMVKVTEADLKAEKDVQLEKAVELLLTKKP